MARILIVEDDFLIAAGLAHLVAELGHEVCGVAMAADRAIQLGVSMLPDLALVDGRLARGTSGLEVVAALRQASIPSILVSAHVSDDEAARVGAVDCLKKPYDAQILRRAISNALNQRHTVKDLRFTFGGGR